jgi:excisionase family DNA binding protein
MKEFFSVLEVAKLLNLSRSAVLYHIKAGNLKATQVGKIILFLKKISVNFLKNIKPARNIRK